MATLTAGMDLGGFQEGFPLPSLALLRIPCQLSHVHACGLQRDEVGGGYSPSLPLTAAPDRAWGHPGSSMLPSGLPSEYRPSGLVTSKVWSLPVKIG